MNIIFEALLLNLLHPILSFPNAQLLSEIKILGKYATWLS
jgi:hypothetical protein